MVESGIFRPQTEEEKVDFKDLNETSLKSEFRKQLSFIEAKYTKVHKPFDARCAINDFDSQIEDVERESERISGFVRKEDMRKIKTPDFEIYGKEDRFEIGGDDEDIEMQNINGVRTPRTIGHTIKYICKLRKHGVSVFIPIEDYNERFVKKIK